MTTAGNNDNRRKPIPGSAAEALEIAETHFLPKRSDGTPAPAEVHEFDLGYLICLVALPKVDAGRPPELGGAHLVISKETGEASYIPNLPPELAISLYRRSRSES